MSFLHYKFKHAIHLFYHCIKICYALANQKRKKKKKGVNKQEGIQVADTPLFFCAVFTEVLGLTMRLMIHLHHFQYHNRCYCAHCPFLSTSIQRAPPM